MAMNRVQFQAGLSMKEFQRLCGTEARCEQALRQWRWPDGFRCPACGGRQRAFGVRSCFLPTCSVRETIGKKQDLTPGGPDPRWT